MSIFRAFTEGDASMKTVAFILSGLVWMAASASRASEASRGDVLELYSCEVFTGGCTASAEATLEGRYALRAWHFTSGPLNGLTVATLQVADENRKFARTVVVGRRGLKIAWLAAQNGQRSFFKDHKRS